MKKLLVLAVVLIVGGVVVDAALRSYAGNRVAAEMQSAFNLTQEPTVAIGGFPFIFDALRGRLDSVKISGAGLEEDGVALTDIDVTLREVRISLSEMISDDPKRVRIRSASGVARLTSAALADALDRSGLDVLAIDPGDVTIEGTTLRLGPVTIDLPVVMEGVSYTGARIEGDAIELRFEAGRTTLEL